MEREIEISRENLSGRLRKHDSRLNYVVYYLHGLCRLFFLQFMHTEHFLDRRASQGVLWGEVIV